MTIYANNYKSSVKTNSFINGNLVENRNSIKYTILGETRLEESQFEGKEKYSIRIKKNSLCPEFILRLIGWTKINYKGEDIWVNNSSLKKEAQKLGCEQKKNITDLFFSFFSKIEKEENKKRVENNKTYFSEKLPNQNIETIQNIANACFNCNAQDSDTYIYNAQESDIYIFDKKNVKIITKELLGQGTYKKVYNCASIHLQTGKKSEEAYIQIEQQKERDVFTDARRENELLKEFKDCKYIIDPYNNTLVKANYFHAFSKKYDGDLLAKRQDLSMADKLQIAVNSAQGLKAIHNRGYVHSDIKPANILLLPKTHPNAIREAAIGDVGVMGKKDAPLISATPNYVPPEIWRNKLNKNPCQLSPKMDVWATGIVLCELFCPTALIPYNKAISQLNEHRKNLYLPNQKEKISATELKKLTDNMKIDEKALELFVVDKNIQSIIKKCLIHDPNQRCTAEDIQNALTPVLEKEIRLMHT